MHPFPHLYNNILLHYFTLHYLLHYSTYFFQNTNSDDINENCIISSLTEQVGTSATSAQGATIHLPEESVREAKIVGAEN
jgi:hypothetical protein